MPHQARHKPKKKAGKVVFVPPGQARKFPMVKVGPNPEIKTSVAQSFSVPLESATPEHELTKILRIVDGYIAQNKNISVQHVRDSAGHLVEVLFMFNPNTPSHEVRACVNAIHANPGLASVGTGPKLIEQAFDGSRLKVGADVNNQPGTQSDLIDPLQVNSGTGSAPIISDTEFFSGSKSLRVGHGAGAGIRYQAFWDARADFVGGKAAVSTWKVGFNLLLPATIGQGPANVDLSIQGPGLQYGSGSAQGYGSQILWATPQVSSPPPPPGASDAPVVNGDVPTQPTLTIPFDGAFHRIEWELIDPVLFGMRLTVDGASEGVLIRKRIADDPVLTPETGFSMVLSWTAEPGDTQLVYMDDFVFETTLAV